MEISFEQRRRWLGGNLRAALLRQLRAGRDRLRGDAVLVIRCKGLDRMARGHLSDERRMNRVTEQRLQPQRHLARNIERHTEKKILLRARPRLAVLVGEREA